MLDNSSKIPFGRGKAIIKPLIFDPKDKQKDEEFKIADENILLNIEQGRYLISNKGRIYDTKLEVYKNPIPNCNPKFRQPYYKTKFNYYPSNDHSFLQKDIYFHRAVAKAFLENDNPEIKTEVDHINGDHSNNNIENLEWVEGKENRIRAVARDYVLSCENHPNSILTNNQVHKICRMLADGYSCAEIGRTFDVSESVIFNIKKGNNYNRISRNYNIPEIIDNKNSKLDDETVHKICQMLENNISIKEIVDTLNVARYVVNDIKAKRNYRKISSQYNFDSPEERRALTETQVRYICDKLEKGEQIVDISKQTGISIATISAIRNGKKYKYISCEYEIYKSGLSDDVVRIICVMIQRGFSNKSIYNFIGGKETGISLAIISNIRNHKSGNHISKDFNF